MNTLRRAVMLVAGIALILFSQGVQFAHRQDDDRHELVFQSFDGSAIYRINPDTLEKTTIVQDTRRYNRSSNVLLSPDGEWVFFYRRDERIWRVNLTGSIIEPIAPEFTSQWMGGFSGDGGYLIFAGEAPGHEWDMYRFPGMGGPPEDLTPGFDRATFQKWLPGREGLIFRDGMVSYCLTPEGTIRHLGDWLSLASYLPTRLSPDGQWVELAVENPNNLTDAVLMRPDCTDHHYLLDPNQFTGSRISYWLPDGRTLLVSAVTHDNHLHHDIYRVRVDGSGLENLTATPEVNEVVTTSSPDGKWIINAVGSRETGRRLYRMKPDGTGSTLLVADYAAQWGWSPDEEWLMFSVEHVDGERLYRIRPERSGTQFLAGPFEAISRLHISPDGEWLYLEAALQRWRNQIFRLRPDGGDFSQLTPRAVPPNLPEPHTLYEWTPDGEWLIFYTWGAGTGEDIHYYRMRPDGSERALLAKAALVGWLPPLPAYEADYAGQTIGAAALILLALIKRPPRLRRKKAAA